MTDSDDLVALLSQGMYDLSYRPSEARIGVPSFVYLFGRCIPLLIANPVGRPLHFLRYLSYPWKYLMNHTCDISNACNYRPEAFVLICSIKRVFYLSG